MPLNIRIQWNAGSACVSECVLKTLACRGLRVGTSKFNTHTHTWKILSTIDFELDTRIAGIHLVTDANAHTRKIFLEWIGRQLVGVWIGGVWNGHFPESEKHFSEAEFSRKIPEIPQKEPCLPNFRLRNLKIQSPKNCMSILPAIPYPH